MHRADKKQPAAARAASAARLSNAVTLKMQWQLRAPPVQLACCQIENSPRRHQKALRAIWIYTMGRRRRGALQGVKDSSTVVSPPVQMS